MPYNGGWWVTDGAWWVTDGGWWVTDGGWRVTAGGNMQTLKRPKKRSQKYCANWVFNLEPQDERLVQLPTKVPQNLVCHHHQRKDAIVKKKKRVSVLMAPPGREGR